MRRPLPPAGTVELAPSILSADFGRLAEHIRQVAPAVRMLHLDIMDGHFVPNLTIGPVVVQKIRPCCDLHFDTHLMISDPLKYAEQFVKAGSDSITFHLETIDDPHRAVGELRKMGVAVGISIKPGTPVESLESIVGEVDMVLLMTVEPGFGGQKFMPDSEARCRTLRAMLRSDQRLEVDGGIDATTAPLIVAAGADTLVAGNGVFGNDDAAAAAKAIIDAVVQLK